MPAQARQRREGVAVQPLAFYSRHPRLNYTDWLSTVSANFTEEERYLEHALEIQPGYITLPTDTRAGVVGFMNSMLLDEQDDRDRREIKEENESAQASVMFLRFAQNLDPVSQMNHCSSTFV